MFSFHQARNELSTEVFPYLKAEEQIKESVSTFRCCFCESLTACSRVRKRELHSFRLPWQNQKETTTMLLLRAEVSGREELRALAVLTISLDIVLFVIGGVSYSECRVPYDVSQDQSRNVMLGKNGNLYVVCWSLHLLTITCRLDDGLSAPGICTTAAAFVQRKASARDASGTQSEQGQA